MGLDCFFSALKLHRNCSDCSDCSDFGSAVIIRKFALELVRDYFDIVPELLGRCSIIESDVLSLATPSSLTRGLMRNNHHLY